ncbi:MAG: TRAFs-binding domain-containing protein [Christensenellaceae bacterium]|jgi:hypothetical protein|nr:TRAFs-binding domain-containing protein [Christensenellaceae bacterium]
MGEYYFSGVGFYDLQESRKKNQEYALRQQEFNKQAGRIKSFENKKDRTAFLKQQFLEKDEFINTATNSQLMRIFVAFRDLGNFDEMVAFYDKCTNETFKNSLMVNELLMVGYNKSGVPAPDKTIELANKLIKENRVSGDVYGALGKAYKIKSNQAASQQESIMYLQKSADAYEAGFAKFAEFYPGINA